MPDPYNLSLTASQIDDALLAASDSDKAPNSGATNLVNSNKIYHFVTGQVGPEASTRAAADTALDGRVTALEKEVLVSTIADGVTGNSNYTFSGFSIPTGVNVTVSEPSTGIFRVSGSGIYRITWMACFYDTDRSGDRYQLYVDVNSVRVMDKDMNNIGSSSAKKGPISYSTLVDLSATSEVDIKISLYEISSNTTLQWTGFKIVLEELT